MTRSTPLILVILVLMLSIIGCRNKHSAHDSRLDISDSIMAALPDSMLRGLSAINHEELKSDYDRALHTLLITIATDKCYLPIEHDSALTAAVEVFHKHNDILNETKARYYAGWADCQSGDYQKAIWEALHAIDLAKEAKDTFWLGRTHDLACEIYLASYDTHNAAIEADSAAFFFKKASATSFHRYSLFMKMAALSYPRKIDGTQVTDGDVLLDSLLSVFKSDKDSSMIAECFIKKARKYATYKDYPNCVAAIDSMRKYSQSIYLHDAALPYLISAGLKKGKNVNNLIEEFNSLKRSTIFDTLSYLNYKKEWVTTQGNLDLVNAWDDSIIFYYTKILGEKINNSLGSVKSDYYALLTQNKERENNELKSHNLKLGILIAIILLTILGISGSLYVYLNYKKTEFMNRLFDIKAERDSLNSSIELKEKLIEEVQTENEFLLEKMRKRSESLLKEIKNENERLKSNILLQTQVISDNNESIKAYKEKIEIVASENESLRETIEKIKAAESKYIQSLSPKPSLLGNRLDTIFNLVTDFFDDSKPEISKNIIYTNVVKEVDVIRSKKFLREFIEEIESTHNKILTRLKAQLPSIKEEDLVWIAMIAAGVTPLSICFILKMNNSTFYSKRRRLRALIKQSSCIDKKEFQAIFGENKDSSTSKDTASDCD